LGLRHLERGVVGNLSNLVFLAERGAIATPRVQFRVTN
jgi:hypothetical protein